MPSRLLVCDQGEVRDRPPEQLSESRERTCWLDVAAPRPEDLDLVAKELGLHPLAVEDALQRYERPKIEQYGDHYFIVFYALEVPGPGLVKTHQVAIFMLQNTVVTVHQEEFSARIAVEKRYREGRLRTAGLLLHALLDTMVDQYFEVVDDFGERVEFLEGLIVNADPRQDLRSSLRELFLVKRDLLQVRRHITPEREVLAVLVRGDIRELREPGRREYFQDVYEHIVRVTDEIDTFRDLTSNVIDAHLASVSNRLNEVMKVLTSVATILLVFGVVTSFFGMNFDVLPFDSATAFWLATGLTGLAGVGLVLYFRRIGYL